MSSQLCEVAKERLVAANGDPFLFADWERVVFLHFAVPSELLRPVIPGCFELDLHEGRACVSLVALTMRRFRPRRRFSSACFYRLISEQRFLNLRTYVYYDPAAKHASVPPALPGGEPGALFLHGWLSRPFGAPLPSGCFGLPYSFAFCDYRHQFGDGVARGLVTEPGRKEAFSYQADAAGSGSHAVCEPGSLAEFALERYTGFFSRHKGVYAFRAWHPSWRQTPLDAKIEHNSLIVRRFPWFREARLAEAQFSAGFKRVWLGRAHSLHRNQRGRCSVLSGFYEMP